MLSRLGIVSDDVVRSTHQPHTVSMRLGDFLRPLADAFYANRTFLSDFADDEVQLPADLMEVLAAYEHLRRVA